MQQYGHSLLNKDEQTCNCEENNCAVRSHSFVIERKLVIHDKSCHLLPALGLLILTALGQINFNLATQLEAAQPKRKAEREKE